MIISRTPLRMSFTGGGSDISSFYREHGGAVISTTIDKYIYVTVNRKFDNGIRVAYSKNEEVFSVNQIKHNLVRNTLEYLGIDGGVEITTIADIPSSGTGLGSSSSFAVGLLHALNAFSGQYVSREQLGALSSYIEIERCGEPIGKQDQYAAAFGGFNLIEFKQDDSVVVSPIICKRDTLETIERNLLVFYTGLTRSASVLLQRQANEMQSSKNKQAIMTRLVKLTYQLATELRNNNTDAFGEILHEGWMLKKSMTEGISNSKIDAWYELARRAGALGGKILGAGAGGFLLICANKESHLSIKTALNMLRPISVAFEPLGSRLILYHQTFERIG
jgi:D-glycero-alpha-D-manno-heptose-7-phosphate kinase